MDQTSGRRAARVAASLAVQVFAGLVAGPVFVVGSNFVVVTASKFLGDWVISGWFYLLFPIVAAAALAYFVHRRFGRLRVFAWTTFLGAAAFHLWFSFVVIASMPGPDF
ncbi:putative membrane protein [Rhodococcus sp. LBL1]|nr:putative membrane protein [Rhodococcus sp. LBL1]MDH6684863.1 putative membrane protein [Rhodococcus sp. LBL2]